MDLSEMGMVMDHVKRRLDGLRDPRVARTRRHPLVMIVAIAACAVIAGGEGWTDMVNFGRTNQDWLAEFLDLPNGIPSVDTFRRVLTALRPRGLKAFVLGWLADLAGPVRGQGVAIDGKTMRGSADPAGDRPAIHTVSAWAGEQGLCLGQLAVEAKSNEITAIPALLEAIDVRGAVVTIDAMGCQRSIAGAIRDAGADYVLALKDNQETLHAHVRAFLEGVADGGFPGTPHTIHESVDMGHGRVETRRVIATDDIGWLHGRERWPCLRTLVLVESVREAKSPGGGGKRSVERRCYISSLPPDAGALAGFVRGHWSVEAMHWMLDIAFHQDALRIRRGHAPENMDLLQKLAMCLLRRAPMPEGRKGGVPARRFLAAMDRNYLFQVLSAGGPDLEIKML